MPIHNYVTSGAETEGVNEVRGDYFVTFAPRLAAWADINPESILVDVPCGTGGMSSSLRKLGLCRYVHLVDINEAMLAAARTAVPDRAGYIVADAADLDQTVPPRSVDVILCLNGWHIYVDRKSKFLDAARRTLRPGGRLVFDVSTAALEDGSRRYFERLDQLMGTDAGSLGSEVNLPRRADQSVIDGYVSMCRSHGFTLLGRHLITRERPISIENEKTLKIPGRMRPRFPQLDDATIRRLFLEASAQAQSDTGVTTLVKSRVFFILAVLGRPAQPAVPGPSMRWARNTRPSNY